MPIVPVELGARSYEVRIGQGLLARAGAEIAPLLQRPRVAVLTDETVAEAHLIDLVDGLQRRAMAKW
jgi:3-dehydroquinate synthase